jgi:hypothetical protein
VDVSEFLQSLVKMTQIQGKSSKNMHDLVHQKFQDLFAMLSGHLTPALFTNLVTPLTDLPDFNPQDLAGNRNISSKEENLILPAFNFPPYS